MQLVKCLEIDDCGVTSEVEEIAAHAAIASPWALLASDVREPMLDRDASSQTLATARRRDQFAKAMLELFVGSDVDGATRTG